MAFQKRFELTKNFPNGDRYRGEAAGDNIKDGKGEFFCAEDGSTYVGDWRNNLKHGHGKLTVPGDYGFTYSGRFEKGERSGDGSCTFNNGRSYVGEWRHDKMHGTGVLKAAPGEDFMQYDGQFNNGLRCGTGRCVYSNGDVYEGLFSKDKRHGLGVLTLSKTGLADSSAEPAPVWYSGEFLMDVPCSQNGEGEIKYIDGSTYKGSVEQLHREGEGTHYLANGDVYTGAFRLNHRDGLGTLRCKDGRTYEGSWQRGKMHGKITYHRPVDSSGGTALPPRTLVDYTGPCVQGEMTGVGARAVLADGTVYYCEVRNGEPINQGRMENSPLTLAPTVFGGSGILLLQRYDGNFFNGVPDGEGIGIIQVLSGHAHGQDLSSRSSSPPGTCFSSALIRTGGSNHSDRYTAINGFRLYYPKEGTYQGKWSQGVPNGPGTWSWDTTAEKFRGTVFQGAPHGRGRYDGPSGCCYDGDFVMGQPSGKGTYVSPREMVRYSGDWKDEYFDGEGELVAGSRQKESHQQGSSTPSTEEEDKYYYKGQWSRGLRHGSGVEETSIQRYEGTFVKGQRHGTGKLVFTSSVGGDGKILLYEGVFTDGRIGGGGDANKNRGVMTLRDGTTISGQFDGGEVHGKAVIEFPQGLKFSGNFSRNRIVGEGTISFPNGDSYTGEVECTSTEKWDFTPQRHGKGVFHFFGGGELQCTWRHNVLHGEGTHKAPNGDVTARCYEDGIATMSKKQGSVPMSRNTNTGTPLGSVNCGKESASPITRPSKDGAGSGGGSLMGSIFTPENEFPNTLSEEQLRDRLANRKPFKYQRKGESKMAVGGGAKEGPSTGLKTPHRTTGGGPGTPRAGAGVRRPSLSEPKNVITRQTASKISRDPTHSSPPPVDSAGGASRRRGSAQGAPGSARITVPGNVHPFQSLPSPSPQPLRLPTSGGSSSSFDVVERFQRGVTGLDEAGSFAGAVSREGAQTPLRGQLAALMKEASSIRNSREDEIHLLTEHMRSLNERIWQLRFCISADGKSQLNPSQHAQLKEMNEERKNIIAKLQQTLDIADE